MPLLWYTPEPGYVGPDRFRFSVSDGSLTSQPAAVTLRVARPNRPPVATNQVVVLTNSAPLRFELDVHDADGDSLRIVILRGTSNGHLAIEGRMVTYIPVAAATTADLFTYRAWDGRQYSAKTQVTLALIDPQPPQPPIIQAVRAGELSLTFDIVADPGKLLQVQRSRDLLHWETIGSITTAGGLTQYADRQAWDSATGFYRLVQP